MKAVSNSVCDLFLMKKNFGKNISFVLLSKVITIHTSVA